MDFDPEEMVVWPGVGDINLKTAVRRFKELPKSPPFMGSVFPHFRPHPIDPIVLEKLAKRPEFQGDN